MHNAQLLGVRQVDRVDLRLSFLVVAGFAAITIISYVNELSRVGLTYDLNTIFRAGLLDRNRRKQLYPLQDSLRHRVERSAGDYDAPHDDALIQKNGQVHQLGLEIHNIKKALGPNNGNGGNREQEINIAVHLGRNSSYLTANNSVRVYHFNNTMPNFFTTLEVPSLPIHDNSVKEVNDTRATLKTWLEAINTTKQAYRKATAVLVYQHDPGGYLTRDCLRSLVHDHRLTAPTNPLNTQYRREWDMMPKFKRNAFKVLYGGLSFGVCEGIGHPCTYMVMVKHPLDRILTVYNICQKNTSSILCNFNKLNVQDMTLQQFIKVQGSSFFRKLLYYSKHCRLVGEDEVCLPDTKTSFVLTAQERQIYLENILENLEKWFSVIGLEEFFNESLQLFESVFGLNYTGCSQPTKLRELMRMDKHLWPLMSGTGRETLQGLHNMSEFTQAHNATYSAIRENLMKNPQVLRWLSADLAIYDKLEELFKKQLDIFNVTLSVIKTMQNPNLPISVAPQLRKYITKRKRRGLLHMNNKREPLEKIQGSFPQMEHKNISLKHFPSHKNMHGGTGLNHRNYVIRGSTVAGAFVSPAEPKVAEKIITSTDHNGGWTTEKPSLQRGELTSKPFLNRNKKLHRLHNGKQHKHHKKYRPRKAEEDSQPKEPALVKDLFGRTETGLKGLNEKVAHTMQDHGGDKTGAQIKHFNHFNHDDKISATSRNTDNGMHPDNTNFGAIKKYPANGNHNNHIDADKHPGNGSHHNNHIGAVKHPGNGSHHNNHMGIDKHPGNGNHNNHIGTDKHPGNGNHNNHIGAVNKHQGSGNHHSNHIGAVNKHQGNGNHINHIGAVNKHQDNGNHNNNRIGAVNKHQGNGNHHNNRIGAVNKHQGNGNHHNNRIVAVNKHQDNGNRHNNHIGEVNKHSHNVEHGNNIGARNNLPNKFNSGNKEDSHKINGRNHHKQRM